MQGGAAVRDGVIRTVSTCLEKDSTPGIANTKFCNLLLVSEPLHSTARVHSSGSNEQFTLPKTHGPIQVKGRLSRAKISITHCALFNQFQLSSVLVNGTPSQLRITCCSLSSHRAQSHCNDCPWDHHGNRLWPKSNSRKFKDLIQTCLLIIFRGSSSVSAITISGAEYLTVLPQMVMVWLAAEERTKNYKSPSFLSSPWKHDFEQRQGLLYPETLYIVSAIFLQDFQTLFEVPLRSSFHRSQVAGFWNQVDDVEFFGLIFARGI